MIHINSTEEKKLDFNIKSFLGEEYLKRFKINYPQILFEPDWEMLKLQRCVLCTNKLKFPKKGNIAICSSKKHRKPFIINKDKLIKASFK